MKLKKSQLPAIKKKKVLKTNTMNGLEWKNGKLYTYICT